MRARAITMLSLFLFLPIPGRVHAQCSTWVPGLFDNGTAPNGTNGTVENVFVWDPSGSGTENTLVIGGQFTTVEGATVSNLALRDRVTGVWSSPGGGIDGPVFCMAEYNNELIVGGIFTHAGGVAANNVARWDGTAWHPLEFGATQQGTDGPVYALTVYGSELAVAGSFTTVGGGSVYAHDVATWDASTSWHTLSAGVGCNVLNCGGSVSSMVTWNGNLVVGGSFTYSSNVVTNYTAYWDGSAWHAMGTGMNNTVTALQPWNGVLVASGAFTSADGHTANYLAQWNGSAWSALGNGANYNTGPMTVYNGSLIVGGGFSQVGGSVAANNIASWNGSSWQALGSGIGGSSHTPLGMIPFAGELVVGGVFGTAGGVTANDLARWNGSAWAPFGGGSTSLVFAETYYHGRLAIAGDFHQSTPSSFAVHEIAGFDGGSIGAFGTGMNASVVALKSFKYSGITGNYELVAGGLFTQAGGVAANYIARWDESPLIFTTPAWQAMGAGFNSGVYAIERFNNVTYAGGAFTASSSTTLDYIAQWNATSSVWQAVATGMNGPVRALCAYNGYLYAGGSFTTAGGVATGGLARWNGSNWSQVGGTFSGTVYALAVYNGQLVIGGTYPGINSSPNLAWWDGTSYGTFATGGTNGAVRALAVLGNSLYVGGAFTTAGSGSASHVAYWDGSAWHDAAGGTDDVVYALAAFGAEMDAGGQFNHADGGSLTSPIWARFSGSGIPWFATQPYSQAVNPGDNVAMSATPSPGYSGVTYRWYHQGVPVFDGATGHGSTYAGTGTLDLAITNVTGYDADNWFLAMTNTCGSDTSSTAFLTVNGVSAVGPDAPAGRTALAGIWPNPSAGTSSVTYSLARGAVVRLDVHDVTGRRVRSIELGTQSAGLHATRWDGTDEDGARVRSGVFILSLAVDGRTVGTRRVAVVR